MNETLFNAIESFFAVLVAEILYYLLFKPDVGFLIMAFSPFFFMGWVWFEWSNHKILDGKKR